jgi:hypothetical protein
MTSDRKIAANRRNAKKSTGPRTEAGRRRSRCNALRYGLAVAIGSQPSYGKDIEALAKALVGGGPPTEFARQVAEAELDLLRIREIRASQLNAVVGNTGAPSEAYAELAENLTKLERYERRAYSRRKRALGALIS